jgi:alkaline phosphatase D
MYKVIGVGIFLLIATISCKKSPIHNVSDVAVIDNSKLLNQVNGIQTIAFGSCSKSDEEQVLWDDISATDPDLWIWLGDAIYGDTEDMSIMRSKYNRQKSNPGYKAFHTKTPVIGIWDDHDYGINNGDKTFAAKAASRNEFFNFLDIPSNSTFRKREGAYQSYHFESVMGKVSVILLDTRYFKDPTEQKKGKYVYNENIDILGNDQWKWLQEELNRGADITIIANGVQVIPKDHKYEKWANYPSSRKRLFEFLDKIDSKVVLLSGDRHFGELSQITLESGKRLSEITTSGMTHTYEGLTEEYNEHRVGDFTNKLNYGLMKISSENIILELRGDNGTILETLVIE